MEVTSGYKDWADMKILKLEATAARRLRLLEEYKRLLLAIMGSHKGSIGSIDNVYLPQLGREEVDAMYDELARELADADS